MTGHKTQYNTGYLLLYTTMLTQRTDTATCPPTMTITGSLTNSLKQFQPPQHRSSPPHQDYLNV